jgi:hypothetical protein
MIFSLAGLPPATAEKNRAAVKVRNVVNKIAASLTLATCWVADAQVVAWNSFQYGPSFQASSLLGNNNSYTGESSMAIDSAGAVYVTGRANTGISEDWLTLKYDSAGNEVWRAVITGRGAAPLGDNARSIAVTSSGEVIVAGTVFDFDPGPQQLAMRCMVVKYSASGGEVWRARPSLPIATPAWRQSGCYRMRLDAAGNIVLSGSVLPAGSSPSFEYAYIAKLSPSGSLEWSRELTGSFPRRGQAGGPITSDAQGNVYAASTLTTSSTSSDYAISVSKFNALTGDASWTFTQTVSDSQGPLRAITIDSMGQRLAVVGSQLGENTSATQATVRIFDTASGALLKSHLLGSSENSTPVRFASINTAKFDSVGNLYAAGTLTQSDLDAFVVKFNSTGEQQWITIDGQLGTSEAADSMDYDEATGLLAIAGGKGASTQVPGAGNVIAGDYLLLRFDGANGQALSRPQISGGTASEFALATRIGSGGTIYIAGNELNGNRQNYGIVLTGSNDQLLWRRSPITVQSATASFVSDAHFGDRGQSAVDAAGNLYVTAQTADGSIRTTTLVRKITPAGTTAWSSVFSASSTTAKFVAVDAAGDVVVRVRTTAGDVTVRKLNSGDGTTVWERTLAGLDSSSLEPELLAIDQNGDVLLNLSPSGESQLVKLDRATGDTRWTLDSNLIPDWFILNILPHANYVYLATMRSQPGSGNPALSEVVWTLVRVNDNSSSASVQWSRSGTAVSTNKYSVTHLHISPSSQEVTAVGMRYAADNITETWVERFSSVSGASVSGSYRVLKQQTLRVTDFLRSLSVAPTASATMFVSSSGFTPAGEPRQALMHIDSVGNTLCEWATPTQLGPLSPRFTAIAATTDGAVATGALSSEDGSLRMGTAQFNSRCQMLSVVTHDAADTRETGWSVQTVQSGPLANRIYAIGTGRESTKPSTLLVQAIDRAQCHLDLDSDGKALATTDGAMALRAMLGNEDPVATARGLRNPNGGVSEEASGNLALTFARRLDLDLDGDGEVRAATDGLILIRAMLGLKGDAVTSGAIVGVPPRSDWASIRTYLNSNCNANFAD